MTRCIVLVIALLASACSASTVIVEEAGSSNPAATAEAPDAPAASPDPAADPTPSVVSDGFGDWYVPVGPQSEPARTLPGSTSADDTASQINAAVPDGYDLSFEWQAMVLTDDGHQARALVPTQWEKDDRDYEYENDRLDFFTEYEIDSGCQGFCLPQQWELLMADPLSSPFQVRAEVPVEIMIDQQLSDPPGRLLVLDRSAAPNGGVSIKITLVRWSNDAGRFLECEASLGEPDRALWPTFADVCIATVGEWLN